MIQSILSYRKLMEELPEALANSPYKKNYIIKAIGMPGPTFYRKLKHLSFTVDEMLAIAKILHPEEAALLELKASIEQGNEDIRLGNTVNHENLLVSLKSMLEKE